MRRLRKLSEAECYIRLYGAYDPTVTLIKLEPRRPRYELRVTGEDFRRGLEQRLDAREPDVEAA